MGRKLFHLIDEIFLKDAEKVDLGEGERAGAVVVGGGVLLEIFLLEAKFGGDGQTGLVECVEPVVKMRSGDFHGESLGILLGVEVAEVGGNGLAGGEESGVEVGDNEGLPILGDRIVRFGGDGIGEKPGLDLGAVGFGVEGNGFEEFLNDGRDVGEVDRAIRGGICVHGVRRGLFGGGSFFEGCQEEVGVELLDVEFGGFAWSGPDDRASLVMNLQHVLVGALAGVAEDAHEDENDVAHEVDGVIVDDNIPNRIVVDFLGGFLFWERGGRHGMF